MPQDAFWTAEFMPPISAQSAHSEYEVSILRRVTSAHLHTVYALVMW